MSITTNSSWYIRTKRTSSMLLARMPSFWQKHERKFYKYGHVYAIVFGLVVVDYIPNEPSHPILHKLALCYSHVFGFVVIILLPIYFFANLTELIKSSAYGDGELVSIVYFFNTLIKFLTVIATYLANFFHFNAINTITKSRDTLEKAFATTYTGSMRPAQQFEFMMYLKFTAINIMMCVQVANIVYEYYNGATTVEIYFAFYSFVLWNYTENMANYFYFVNSNILKFYQQLNEELQQIVRKTKLMHYFRLRQQRSGTVMHLCCLLCEQLDEILARCKQIHSTYVESVRINEFQILGVILTTLISNLTNIFSIFNIITSQNLNHITAAIPLNIIHAFVFFVDTYVVSLINEQIKCELINIGHTMGKFSQLQTLDERLDCTIENFALQWVCIKSMNKICGLFYLDRHLNFLIAATGFSYFITLVQLQFEFK